MNQSHSNALSPVTADNHQTDLWIVTVIYLIFVVITCWARGYVRLHMLNLNDRASFASTFVGVVERAVVFAGVSAGTGKASKLLDNNQEATV